MTTSDHTDDEPTIGPIVEREIGEAISAVLARHDKSMVIKWVALVEAMDGDGERALWTLTSDDLKAWDTVGLLQHGLHLQHAGTLAARIGGE
jgi:hypothetical protein